LTPSCQRARPGNSALRSSESTIYARPTRISSSDLDEAFRRANVDLSKPLIKQGHDMLIAFVVTLKYITEVVERSTKAAA
jgi:hypothetical protein